MFSGRFFVVDKRQESIFIGKRGGGYKLKDGVKFHLYINTAPCGDARIFSPHEDQTNIIDKHPNRRARGQLRTKIESGEGTIPVKSSNNMQTWDGILQVVLVNVSLENSLFFFFTFAGRTFAYDVVFR